MRDVRGMTTSPAATLSPSRERLAVAALAVGAFVTTVNAQLVGPLQPYLSEAPIYARLAEDDFRSAVGSLISATQGAGAVAALLLGPLVDRVGRRGPMVVGALLFVLASAAHLLVARHVDLVVVRMVSGFGGGLVFMAASAAVADLVPYERRGAAMGVFSLGLFLATPLGVPIGLWVAQSAGPYWRWSFAWLALPGLVAVAGFLLFLPRHVGRSSMRVSQWRVLRAPYVVPALLSVLLYTGAFFTTMQFASGWLEDTGLVPRERQSVLWISLGLLSAAGALILPRFSDRLGKRSTVLASSAAVAVCLLTLAWVDSVAGLWAVGVPLAMVAAARTPALQALMSEIVEPRMRGTLMGLRAAAVQLGGAVFAAATKGVYAEHGFPVFLQVAAAAIALAFVMVWLGVRVEL